MKLPKEAIIELQQLYQTELGIDLSLKESEGKAIDLLTMGQLAQGKPNVI